jgi:hypothetical protein
MEKTLPRRYTALIGFGLIYLWATTLIVWVDWSQSDVLFVKSIGVIGASLASLSGIAIFLHVSDLETQLRASKEKNALNEALAQEYKDQSQLAILLLEKERSKSVN